MVRSSRDEQPRKSVIKIFNSKSNNESTSTNVSANNNPKIIPLLKQHSEGAPQPDPRSSNKTKARVENAPHP